MNRFIRLKGYDVEYKDEYVCIEKIKYMCYI